MVRIAVIAVLTAWGAGATFVAGAVLAVSALGLLGFQPTAA